MKKFYLLLFFLSIMAIDNVNAQKVESVNFRQSQSRINEPNMAVFVRPLVVDLEVINQERVESESNFPNVKLTDLTSEKLYNLKATALFECSQTNHADVIIGAMFDIQSFENNNGYGIKIKVVGYPAKYTNWKPATSNDEYEWILDVYGTAIGQRATGAKTAIK